MNKLILAFAFVLFIGFVSAQVVTSDPNFLGNGLTRTASFTSYGSSFSSYYGSNANTYWPILSNRDSCTSSQDILIQVSPVGCQPSVVRSDLLAEQNVPVFCQLDLLQINPIIDIKQIRNIRFSGRYPDYVAGVGFHPANAALRTTNSLLGTPLQSNIGYVVVVLKRNPDEKTIPNFFNFTLSASVDYYSGNSVGIGATELLLKETNDAEWNIVKNKQTLFNGKMSVRVSEVDSNNTLGLEIYSGDRKYSELTLRKNQVQPTPVYLPGSYCQTALQFSYTDFISPSLIARLRVDDDILDLYDGSRFLNNKCTVRKVYGDSVSGSIDISCGNQKIFLNSSDISLSSGERVWKINKDLSVDKSKEYSVLEVIRNESGVFYKLNDGSIVLSGFVRPISSNVLQDANYGDYESYLRNATQDYEAIADSYGNEKKELGKTYGDFALSNAINLNLKYGKNTEAIRLIEKYLDLYPDGNSAVDFTNALNNIYSVDSSISGTVVQSDDGYHLIRLLDVNGASKKSSATISWGREEKTVEQGGNFDFSFGTLSLTSIKDSQTVEISARCTGEDRKNDFNGNVRLLNTVKACGQIIKVSKIDAQSYYKVRISPVTRSGEITNFTVGIGIEKRAIELTPAKANKKIENLNKTIQKFESISKTLNGVVTNLKAACFATAGVLTVKNFFTGLSGEALARRGAMSGENGWTNFCQNAVNAHNYTSLTACYNANSQKIASDVSARQKAIEDTNRITQDIEKRNSFQSRDGVFAGTSFDDVTARTELIDKIRSECSNVNLGIKSSGIGYSSVGSLLPSELNATSYSYSELRDVYFNCKVVNDPQTSTQGKLRSSSELDSLGKTIGDNLNYQNTLKNYNGAQVYSISSSRPGNYYGSTVSSLINQNSFSTSSGVSIDNGAYAQIIKADDGNNYLVTLKKQGDQYVSDKVYTLTGNDHKVISSEVNLASNNALKNLPGVFNEVGSGRYNNQFSPGENVVKYFETEPYKGMPAIVPFDLNRGFYAATSQALPIFGGTKSYEDNGKPSNFFVCNIMGNKRVDFNAPNYGDDECVQFNAYTGQSYSNFPGLSESESKKLVNDAVKALQDAAQQYGKKNVRIGSNTLNVGDSASLLPGSQCQDYMSPEECKILFNVCDPVICPVSRCNFGGEYYVSDVVQSGIVGSALLCLPNINDGIVVPVCLTGIKAGVDGYLSILKSHQQCLQESIDTGQYVGICDQISSVYLCEFFWRQAAPLAKTLVPKLVETAYTGGPKSVRGGGEYLTVQSSWQNAQDSAEYFTQSYASNSFDAFKIRSTEEAGTELCRAFISAKVPNTFETLVQADSPPQFHAWYSSIDFTDATFPATSQYKVFYHIFAGNDRGVSYSVYLKDPPSNSQYATSPVVVVSTGFISKGQYATESKDFTAPKGYKQLCVRINDKEECGFKEVSSSFAVNYVSDKIVSDELARTDIATETECVSGSLSPTSLLNPNLQSAGEEALNPSIYNRGIVRICSTDNPGSATDPSRFVQVGVCGSDRLKCWLDKNSVQNAISDSNAGLKNETLSEITKVQQDNLNSQKYSSPTSIASEINDLQGSIDSADSSSFNGLLIKINSLMDKAFWNSDKASVLLLRAKLYSNVFAKSVSNNAVSIKSVASVADSSSAASNNANLPQTKSLSFKNYSSSSRNYFYLDGKKTFVFVLGNGVYIDFGQSEQRVGSVNNGRILFVSEKELVDSNLFSGAYDMFDEKTISVSDVVNGLNF